MLRWVAPILVLGLLLTVTAARAEAAPVAVEVSTASGGRLGRLVGEWQGSATYFPLTDVARLASASTRRAPGGDRISLVTRHGVVQLAKDARQISVDGRAVSLAAPVRVRQGAWRVPGDLLVRGLPTLLGAGVRVTPTEIREARPVPPGLAKPSVRPAVASAPRAVAVPALALPRPVPPAGAPSAALAPAEPVEPARPEPESPRAPVRPAGRSSARVELRIRSYPTYTRMVVEADAPLEPRLVETEAGLTIAFPEVNPRGWTGTRTVRDGLVATAELGESRGAASLRVAFERQPAARKVFRLEDPPRVVLDFHRQALGATAPTPGEAGPEALRTIVVDPGHGGHDAGAVGPTGLQEKELTLDISRRVAALLQEELGVRVVLTRARDQFLGLRERTALANRERADLFVSIHVNAAPGGAATGTETYFLSNEATDGAARRAAEYENRLIGGDTRARGGAPDVLRSILWDLAQSDFQQESSRVAEALQNNLDRALRRPSRGVKQAPFYVLGGAAMPAVLVEIGFISNPEDEQRLRDDGYRDRIARALAAGVAGYKRSYDERAGVLAKR
ncbi:MAG TPA: N-acetylmuramoyl-L-alanine amidase [Methylomirabilota bacterium]|nr:N-acetylmuramoyl-L-alanine amidase [Methylomirabilota bacterium]